MRRSTRAITVLLYVALAATGAHACPIVRGGATAPVASIERGAVRLVDGTRLVPPGAVIPTLLDPSQPRTQAAENAGRRLLEGRVLTLAPVSADRYGRLPASATLLGAMGPADLAVTLVEAGAAYADPAGRPACADALLTAERAARAARRGLWVVPGAILQAADGEAARQRVGLFSLVEGQVYRARRAGSTLYVNFTSPQKSSLVATTVGKSINGLDPAILTGTLVRVRGLVDDGARLAFEPNGIELAGSTAGRRRGTNW